MSLLVKTKSQRNIRILLVILSCCLCCWSFVLALLHSRLAQFGDAFGFPTLLQKRVLQDGAPPVFGVYSTFGSVEAVYALPSNDEQQPNKGIALLLHACTHSALKFFSPSADKCKSCVGLSEELRISRILLEEGYKVLALTSADGSSGCWGNKDVPRVEAALDEFQRIHGSSQKNVVAIGASSGGRFAAILAAHGIANAALVMVSSLDSSLQTKLLAMRDKMPPIYLAPMPKDVATLKRVREDYKALLSTEKIVLDEKTCVKMAVTPEFLNNRVPNLSIDMAREIVSTLIRAGHLDMETQFWLKNPTTSNWRTILRQECGETCLRNQNLGPGVSPLAKAFHRAWAFHEYCSEVIPKALEFFQSRL